MKYSEMMAMERKKRKPRKRPRHVEDEIQQQCVRWFDIQYKPLKMLLHHSPNGGYRTEREGARFKAMGTRAGFPDLVLMLPNAQYHYLAIEMKTPEKGSKQSRSQVEMEALMTAAGGCYRVCRSLEEFIAVVEAYIGDKDVPTLRLVAEHRLRISLRPVAEHIKKRRIRNEQSTENDKGSEVGRATGEAERSQRSW